MLIVPKNPFVLWCLRHFDYEAHGKERPVWNKIAGSGLKMYNDDPYHSDWMIGAGVPLDATYDHDEDSFGAVVRSCAYSKMSDITAEYTGHAFTVLAKSNISWYSGKIVHAEPGKGVPPGSIVVVPSAGPDYQLAMETASKTGDYGPGCIICETGGKLAHLSIVGREMNCLVLMLPNACTMYRDGEHVFIDVEAGTITSHI
jgi:phosphohistidine swiveling domain-containing protein